ncbi:dihydrolipoyl dehydrogenase [Aquisalimonas sp.]|uniref:dihydrolipoyl dehydrogenase n=1 Tax=unclassified Aquisalimonas TaxID=2644645 RepID=UPI0025BA83B7|nr:dihydrolipoyl dehydrogenase [Aquisalimonas sp.]
MKRNVELAIIGGGTAGLSALKEAGRSTRDTVLIDPGPLGTTCARVGCMPSKALLHAARDVAAAREAIDREHLVDTAIEVDVPAVMAHVQTLRDRFAAVPAASVRKLGERYIAGQPRFLDAQTLDVNGEHIQARHIIVATGTRPLIPTAWAPVSDRILTSDTLFDQADLPGRIAVIGLGPIGLELGQALGMLGLDVHAFGHGARLGGLQRRTSNTVAKAALNRHMAIHTGTDVVLQRTDEGVCVHWGEGQTLTVDRVLAAVGRQPNVEGLGLEALDVPLDRRGLPEIDPRTLRVADLPVFFAGDVHGLRPLMHEAADEGVIAARQALQGTQPQERRTPLAIVFTEPGFARVGVPVADLPSDAVSASFNMAEQGRAILMNRPEGVLHVDADASGRLLGAELVAPEAEHLGHALAWLIQQRVTVDEALQLPFYHPVLEEGLRSVLQALRRQ